MSRLGTVAVIGLGVIGGSVARGLAAGGIRVVAHDTDRSRLDAAIREGVISARLAPDLEDIGETDAVVIAVHGGSAIDVLNRLGPHVGTVPLVTDVGSTKQAVVAAAEAAGLGRRFIGSHPYAGDHRSGWEASRGDLFLGERVYLCPAAESTAAALANARQLWVALGARPVTIDAAAHDDMMAWTSHLPHLVSTAFALALDEAGLKRGDLGKGGRDVARLAGGSEEMWTAISLNNAVQIAPALAAIEQQVRELRYALGASDAEALRQRFLRARSWSA